MESQTIGQVSKHFNVSARTLRYYEQMGLILPAKNHDNAYRIYDMDSIIRLQQIIILRKLRIPLKQIAEILKSDDAKVAIEVFKRSLSELDVEITALSTIRGVIASFIKRLNFDGEKLALLDDENLLEIVDSLTVTKINFKEDKAMENLNQAEQKLNKLTDKNVRIVYLPPSYVAACQYEGDEPEKHVGEVVDNFVRQSNLMAIKPDVRHYGFNAPDPADGAAHHGYEMWVTIPDDFDVPAPLTKKHFNGGLYGAHMINMGAFEEWQWLFEWVGNSEKYEYRSDTSKGGENMNGLMEEFLNYYSHVKSSADSYQDVQLDLLIPIKEK